MRNQHTVPELENSIRGHIHTGQRCTMPRKCERALSQIHKLFARYLNESPRQPSTLLKATYAVSDIKQESITRRSGNREYFVELQAKMMGLDNELHRSSNGHRPAQA